MFKDWEDLVPLRWISPKPIDRFNAIPIKVLAGFLKTLTSSTVNLGGKAKDLEEPNHLEEKKQVGRLTLLGFKA